MINHQSLLSYLRKLGGLKLISDMNKFTKMSYKIPRKKKTQRHDNNWGMLTTNSWYRKDY